MAAKTAATKLKPVHLSENGRFVLERRYLAKDDAGNLVETPAQLFRRVADNIAAVEGRYLGDDATSSEREAVVARHADAFYALMTSLRFLPNSPTLGNAGRPLQQLAACFVLPVEDSMTGIFETVKQTALIHQSGGGTGFAFSRLRPAGDIVATTGGVASGPISFMKVFDAATEAIKQGGTRRGANMAVLAVRHLDIEAFVDVKADMVTLTNFNISVAVDDAFMRAVEDDAEYDLVSPRTGEVVGRRSARAVFDRIVANAWQNGDPGLVFLDRINRDNPTPVLGAMEATNPCGEQPLLPYESCNLGSLNLARFARPAAEAPPSTPSDSSDADAPLSHPSEGSRESQAHPERFQSINEPELRPEPVEASSGSGVLRQAQNEQSEDSSLDFDWDALGATIDLAVRFLDDVIDANLYPIPEIERQTKLTRKIGLGVMGWADLLYGLGIPYDSEAAIELADRLMAFIRERADQASAALAAERGPFPAWEESVYGPNGPLSHPSEGSREPQASPERFQSVEGSREPQASPERFQSIRNATRTTVAPTGTLSIIADCSGGIEPAFALAFTRQHYLDPKHPDELVRLTEVNGAFAAAAEAGDYYSQALIDHLAAGGRLADRPEVPEAARRLFVTAHDIAPEWHVRMQAAFQRHTDNAVSKTINFPRQATLDDVAAAYRLAHSEGCKGITIYRDGSRAGQVLSLVADGDIEHDLEVATLSHPSEGSHEPQASPERFQTVEGSHEPQASPERFRSIGSHEPEPRPEPVEGAHPERFQSIQPLQRRHLPDERRSLTHKFRVGEQEGFVTVGLFDDGSPGEIFVTISKEGSTIRGLMDSVAMLTSYALQYGVPLTTLVEKFRAVHFEPAGLTANPELPQASSIVDYIFRWLELRFLAPPAAEPADAATTLAARVEELALQPPNGATRGRRRARRGNGAARGAPSLPPRPALPLGEVATGILCPDCGQQIVFSEGCLVCRACGYTKCG